MPTAQEAASRLLNPSPPAAMHEAMLREKKAVRDLPSLPLFSGPKAHEGFLTFEQRVKLAAQRAKAIVTAYGN
ncbi:hypothetical protein PHLCEN_2v12212 [Hermanssonia centrifuga]|uniref:Uncharacterized protein n=1 Tax=Hermanssonia centrifuga TaxID=98765 RepID=A0A2R6NJ13_9APHY|nr:hypothetical protein PHLCEN_2v12212 [Hermanssonia centrifuga]